MEFGAGQVARIDVTFLKGQPPHGTFDTPTEDATADKERFGTSRVARWFGPGAHAG
jgi:sulfide:quinone oxidoreductase